MFSCWDGVLCAEVTGGVFVSDREEKGSARSSARLKAALAQVALDLQLTVCTAKKCSAFGMMVLG